MRAIALVFAALAALIAAPVSAQEFPALSGRVVDQANVIPEATEAELTAKLATLEQTTQRQLVVVTLADLQGYDIADYGYQLGRNWGIGDAERNDGALLIVAPNDRKVRIEVGYGLEGYLTDAVSSLIISNSIIPRFKAGDMPGGIVAGTDAIITQLRLPPEEAARIAAEASQAREQDSGFPIGGLIWLVFILLFFIFPIIGGASRRRKYHSGLGRTVGDIILWEAGNAIARSLINGGSGGGGGGWSGGGGGGGFSGGGGSFGGGGASGGW